MSNVTRTFLLKRFNDSYVKMVSNPNDIPVLMTQVTREMRAERYGPFKIAEKPRLWEIRSPGQQKREDLKEAVRKRHRAQTNFLCRYVLASKKRYVPLS